MDLTLPQKQGENGVKVALRAESKTHVKPYNHGPILLRKQGVGEL